ncbi:hypothetical protein AAMO2058_000321100 [Amorphochlora amoebiformis]|uniref:Uncharacterized protein n=1 Tax=Amorphochlora amoebiformis TaxID=1561963 RepID=A0A6T6S2U7_9EUKA|mmetsp:Transcript_11868/g.18858  ORF Transcript_11868/g.18858 Transcript_11868/m.18858 type:complete len:111 (+) Transcript_11868:66-398(+)
MSFCCRAISRISTRSYGQVRRISNGIKPYTASTSTSGGSSLSQRLGAFVSGVAVAGVFGYVGLRRDIYEASEGVDANMKILHNDVINASNKSAAKILALEKRIEKIENKP